MRGKPEFRTIDAVGACVQVAAGNGDGDDADCRATDADVVEQAQPSNGMRPEADATSASAPLTFCSSSLGQFMLKTRYAREQLHS